MTESKHTPTPWVRDERTVYALNAKGTNRTFISVQGGFDDNGKRTSAEELAANAEAIVRAVNSFEPMLEALTAARDFLDDDRPVVNAADEADNLARVQMLIDAALATTGTPS